MAILCKCNSKTSVITERATQAMAHFFVCVFPLSPCAALISGILIIAWPHGCPSSLREEAETGEGR